MKQMLTIDGVQLGGFHDVADMFRITAPCPRVLASDSTIQVTADGPERGMRVFAAAALVSAPQTGEMRCVPSTLKTSATAGNSGGSWSDAMRRHDGRP
jgi:hypothetical protein